MMRTDPADIPAEQAVLGAMMLSPATAERIARMLSTGDFYRMAHGQLFGVMTQLMARGTIPDPIVMNTWMQDNPGRVFGIDAPYLHTLIASVPVIAQAEVYAATVRRHAVTRRLCEASDRLVQWTSSPVEDPAALTERMLRELEAARAEGTGSLAEIQPSHLFLNVAEGEDDYDWIIPNLLERKDRLILTGTEGGGKSTLFRQMAVMAAAGIHPFSLARHEPARCAIFDFENSARHTRRQLMPLVELAVRVTNGAFEFENLWIKCRTGGVDLSLDKGVSWLLQQVSEAKPDIVFLGPLYKLAPRALNDDSDAAPVLNALDLIRERECCVILEAHSGHAMGPGGVRDVRVRGSAAFMGWPEFAYGLRWAHDAKGRPLSTRTHRVMDFVSWRGDRDERKWPAQLESGGLWPWSECVPEDSLARQLLAPDDEVWR